MPVRYSIDLPAGMVCVEGSGVTTLEELSALQQTLRGDPDYVPQLGHLIDFRTASLARMDAASLRTIIENSMTAGVPDAGSRAIVVSGELEYGIARMFQNMAEAQGQEARIFTDIGAARAWLERTATLLHRLHQRER